MLLYHFSNVDVDILRPDTMGENSYSKRISADSIKRLFFYDVPVPQEYHLNGKLYRYAVDVPEASIYNLIKDKQGLIAKHKDIYSLLDYIRRNYAGCLYNCGFDCYILFEAIRPIEKVPLMAV